MRKIRHFMYVPFTGLGLYNGYRGDRWLRNRIQIFKQFVVTSLLAQSNQNFTVWVSWRRQERGNKRVAELETYLKERFGSERVVFTYHGVCFWDDKYEDDEARERLINSVHGSIGDLINYVGDVDDVLMTIQPSDDCYRTDVVEYLQREFQTTNYTGIGFQRGFITNYQTKEVREYNPKTNPPFYTIKFPKDVFIDPFKHVEYTGPYKSHEYVPDNLVYKYDNIRAFMVGTHGENISTVFNHPYAGDMVDAERIRMGFALGDEPLRIKYSLRKQIMRKLPHGWQRKLRYIFGERFYAKFYKFIRS